MRGLSTTESQGFVRNKGEFRTVGLPDVAGINNAGVFVGSYIAENKKSYGYIATPQSAIRISNFDELSEAAQHHLQTRKGGIGIKLCAPERQFPREVGQPPFLMSSTG
jgi:hypothetical protein